MRRQKKSSGLSKIMTSAAVIAALTAGTINVYAAQGFEKIQLPDGTRISVQQAADDAAYRAAIIAAFNRADALHVSHDEANWYEISETATAANPINPIVGSPYQPYV